LSEAGWCPVEHEEDVVGVVDQMRIARARAETAAAGDSIVSADRVVFNVKGNDYRLVAAVDFEKTIVWIKWIGTHRDYDKIDVREVRHGGGD